MNNKRIDGLFYMFPCSMASIMTLGTGMILYTKGENPFNDNKFMFVFLAATLATCVMSIMLAKERKIARMSVKVFILMCVLAYCLTLATPTYAVLLTVTLPVVYDVSAVYVLNQTSKMEKEALKNLVLHGKDGVAILTEYGNGIDYIDGHTEYEKLARHLSRLANEPVEFADFYIDRILTKKEGELRFIHVMGGDDGVSVVPTGIVKEEVFKEAEAFLQNNPLK